MFLNAFRANIGNIKFDKATFLPMAIVEYLISETTATLPIEVRSKSHNSRENTNLCDDMYELKTSAAEFVIMMPSQMQNEEFNAKDSEYIEESSLAFQVSNTAAGADTFKRGKCILKMCTFSQLQTRSCAEAMITFVTCTDCGYRWKF